jgi:hypothetical protein
VSNPIFPGYAWGQRFDVVNLSPGETLAGATISAGLTTDDGLTELLPAVNQVDGGAAEYAANRVYIEFSAAQTTTLASRIGQSVRLMVKVARGGRTFLYSAGVFPVQKATLA